MCDIPFICIYLIDEPLPLLDHVWAFMTIDIYPLFCLLTFVAKSKLEPSHGCWLRDCGLDLKCGEYDMVYMMAQHLWGHGAKGLSCKINTYIIQDCLVVEE